MNGGVLLYMRFRNKTRGIDFIEATFEPTYCLDEISALIEKLDPTTVVVSCEGLASINSYYWYGVSNKEQ